MLSVKLCCRRAIRQAGRQTRRMEVASEVVKEREVQQDRDTIFCGSRTMHDVAPKKHIEWLQDETTHAVAARAHTTTTRMPTHWTVFAFL